MPLLNNALVPETEFKENFNNAKMPQRTLVLFNIKKKDSDRGFLGYEYNNSDGQHAEDLVLNDIEEYWPENKKVKYKITLYSSYTPCHRCSATIQSFLERRNDVCMEIRASSLYFHTDSKNRTGLCHLKNSGVSIKMMDRCDYQRCFNMFVHPSKKFNPPWPTLDDKSKENADALDKLWEKEGKESEEKGRATVNPLSHGEMIDSPSTSVMKERTLQPGTETPQKQNTTGKTTKIRKGTKRKLFED